MQWDVTTHQGGGREVCNYVTCAQGHKMYVIWSPERKRFAFTCEECNVHSERAISLYGLIEVRIVKPPRGE